MIGRRPVPWLCERPFAHRGLHDSAAGVPENSLAAFDAALQGGYGIELDVRLLASGEPVVFHDAELMRLTGRSGRIADTTRDELAALRLSGTNQPIPLLADVLDRIGGRVPLLVEIKNEGRPGALENAVCGALRAYAGTFAVISFNPFSLGWFCRNAPEFLRGQTAALFRGAVMPVWRRLAQRDFLLNGVSRPDFLLYEIGGLPRWSVSLWRFLGWPLVAYTVGNRDEERKARASADSYVFEGFRA